MKDNKNILVGKIVAPQGIRGEVRVQTFTAKSDDFKKLSVFGDNIASDKIHFVRSVPHTNVIIAQIDGIIDRNMAETLRGTSLFISRDDLPELKQNGEYYQSDLIGFAVEKDGKIIGHVDCFQNFGAGDIIELDNGDMVSFIGANVDFERGIITVK